MESLRDPGALEASLNNTLDVVRNSLTDAEADQREDIERSFSEHMNRVISQNFPESVGNRVYHSTLADLVADVRAAMDRLGYEVHEDVTFGILPTGQVNGRACAVPAGGLIVAIDDGLFNYAYSLAKAVAALCEVAVTRMDGGGEVDISWIDHDIVRSLRNNEEASRRWLEILFATFVLGYPNANPMRPMVGDRVYLSTMLTTAVEFFLVAHEFGHLILGHYERNHTAVRRMLPGGVEVDEFATARAEEFEADRIGLELLHDFHQNGGIFSLDNTRWAVHFWTGCLNVIELMSGGPSSTHPSANDRGRALLKQLALEDGAALDAPSFGLDIYNVMAGLWVYNEQRFEEWVRRAEHGEMPWNDS